MSFCPPSLPPSLPPSRPTNRPTDRRTDRPTNQSTDRQIDRSTDQGAGAISRRLRVRQGLLEAKICAEVRSLTIFLVYVGTHSHISSIRVLRGRGRLGLDSDEHTTRSISVNCGRNRCGRGWICIYSVCMRRMRHDIVRNDVIIVMLISHKATSVFLS